MTQAAVDAPQVAPLIEGLDRLVGKDDRAALARLRRALGKSPGEATEAHRYVARFLPTQPNEWRERCLYLVAALYATHPPERRGEGVAAPPDENLGRSCARLVEQDANRRDSVERRFVALLAADEDDLAQPLRQMIQLIAAAKQPIPVNYSRLLTDLSYWRANDHRVRRRWAQAFWRVTGASAADAGGLEGAADSTTDDAVGA